MLFIQKLKPTDAPRLSKLALAAYKDHYLNYWTDNGKWYMEKYFSILQLEEELNNPKSSFYIALHDTVESGFLKVNSNKYLSGQLGEGYEIERIYFKKEFTGKGLGGGLLEFALADATQQSRQYVWLKSMDTAYNAINFYQKHGFEVIEEEKLDFELMLPEKRGMVILRKIL